MAKCPQCGAEIKWDGCQDAFVFGDGVFLEEKVILDDAEKELEIREIICECGEVVGIWHIHPDQTTIFNHQEWDGIDWMSPPHSL